jgi:hypothetical protein
MLRFAKKPRGMRLGERLKHYQRDIVREMGVEKMFWTFDPLVARNAHFNLNRLGASVAEYLPNFYGSNTGSILHGRFQPTASLPSGQSGERFRPCSDEGPDARGRWQPPRHLWPPRWMATTFET